MWSLLPSALQRSRTDHVPVLADEVRGLLAVTPGETVVDATFGAGGHARVLAADLKGKGRFIAIDRDSTVRPFFERFEREAGVQARFLRGELSVVLSQLGANRIEADAILIDLGVSSMQIDRPERGFSYAVDAPLDMRMDPSGELSAKEIVNEWDERELATIFRRYGEERFARQIAQAIVRRRQEKQFERTGSSSTSSSRPSPHRAASATAIPRSACSRRSGSPSTRNSTRSSARCRLRSRCCGRAAGSWSSASTPSKIVWSSAFSPPRHAGARARPSFPSASAETSRRCAS